MCHSRRSESFVVAGDEVLGSLRFASHLPVLTMPSLSVFQPQLPSCWCQCLNWPYGVMVHRVETARTLLSSKITMRSRTSWTHWHDCNLSSMFTMLHLKFGPKGRQASKVQLPSECQLWLPFLEALHTSLQRLSILRSTHLGSSSHCTRVIEVE